MKIKISLLVLFALFFLPNKAYSVHFAEELSGKILLQVEKNGEAWYVYPEDGHRYYLGRPNDAFEIMKKLSLGARHDFIGETEIFPERLAGMILLDVESHGEAYYIHPESLKKHYLGRPGDAFEIMRKFGLGITNRDLIYIPISELGANHKADSKDSFLIKNVPFTPQAPFGDWSDQRQQDGCEESSALMAVRWAEGERLTYEEALEEIINASDYLEQKYGEYRDISGQDTVDWIFKDYFGYENIFLRKNISVQDMIYELGQGNLLITPMNGQIMHNPYFSPPGPPRHMIVIKGYDAEKNVFITNDPGTRHGQDFEYDAEVLFGAIRDYPTGYHEYIDEIEKNMIIVWK